MADLTSTMIFSEDIIRQYEILYYVKMKSGTNADKYVLLKAYKEVMQNNEVQTQNIQFYSEKSERVLNTGTTKAFVMDGYFTREESVQEFIDIADFNKISNEDTEYEIIKVMIYKTTAVENVFISHKYMTNVIVTHISADGRLEQFNNAFNVKGELEVVLFDTKISDIVEPPVVPVVAKIGGTI